MVVCKSEPLAFLNDDRAVVGGFFLPWCRVGYRIKGCHLMARLGAGGTETTPDVDANGNIEHVNAGNFGLASLVLSTPFLDIKRFELSGIGGYQYSDFDVYYTDDPKRKYKYFDSGVTLGAEMRFNFKKNEKNEKAFVGFSYEYVFIRHPLRCLSMQIGVSGDAVGNGFIKFRYYNQKDTFNLYVLTAGGYWYLWF